MSGYLAKLTLSAATIALLAGPALAQNTPLALPPLAASQDLPQPVIISAPITEPSGLALPPTTAPTQTPPPDLKPAAQKPVIVSAPVTAAQPAITPPSVETTPITDIKPDSIGLLAKDEGGLGANLWKGTSRALIEHFMPLLTLPSPYASLNDLARRFLLTTAASPEGNNGKDQALTALRVERLVALGSIAEAWKLINIAGADEIDDMTLRQVVEAAMVSSAAGDVCARLPELMKKHTGIEWQKSMLVCQLQAKDTKAAQVSLDLLHAQDMHDDAFFAVAEKNLIGGNKQLPRQLTPLRPLTLALLRLTDLPLRNEIYAHPDATLIPVLLSAKAADETARLALAERAAAKGIIGAGDLAEAYRSENFSNDALSNTNIGGASGPLLRAALYQASLSEKNAKNRAGQAVKFFGSLDPDITGGGVLTLLGNMLGDVPPGPDFTADAATITRIYILANKPNNALAWLDLAHGAARGMPQVAMDLQKIWPLMVLAGLEQQNDFAHDLSTWLNASLPPAGANDSDARAQKANVIAMLVLLDATGFPVTDEAWAKTADPFTLDKTPMPPASIMEKLRTASAANHKGETILMALLATTAGKEDPALPPLAETIRALRAVGLTGDAAYLAKEAAVKIMTAPGKS